MVFSIYIPSESSIFLPLVHGIATSPSICIQISGSNPFYLLSQPSFPWWTESPATSLPPPDLSLFTRSTAVENAATPHFVCACSWLGEVGVRMWLEKWDIVYFLITILRLIFGKGPTELGLVEVNVWLEKNWPGCNYVRCVAPFFYRLKSERC